MFCLVDNAAFIQFATETKGWILDHFDWLFNWSSFLFLILLVAIYFSKFGKVVIGGNRAIPVLSKWKWFSITLCTTIAAGILFWATSEPLYHFHEPPTNLGITPRSAAAAQFSMSTLFMHWTFTPYAIYTLASVAFAYSFYNKNQKFSVNSLLYPLFKGKSPSSFNSIVDTLCLFALVAGMSASLGAGILTISGGIVSKTGISSSTLLLGIITLVLVLCFVASAASGLQKGIKTLSDINIKLFLVLACLFLIGAPLTDILHHSWSGITEYIVNFIPRSINLNESLNQEWTHDWTAFYWANWMAWTPVTALFLGRLAKGYTVQTMIRFNLIYPSLFCLFWIAIFSGSTLSFDINSVNFSLYQSLQNNGPESTIYDVINQMSLGPILIIITLIVIILSLITAYDSNTSAMSAMCTKGITPENAEAPFSIKLIWGASLGLVSWVMVSFSGVDGIRTLSVLGGLPSLFVLSLVFIGMIRLVFFSTSTSE